MKWTAFVVASEEQTSQAEISSQTCPWSETFDVDQDFAYCFALAPATRESRLVEELPDAANKM